MLTREFSGYQFVCVSVRGLVWLFNTVNVNCLGYVIPCITFEEPEKIQLTITQLLVNGFSKSCNGLRYISGPH